MKMFSDFFKKHPFLGNRYFLTVAFFMAWIVFFDKNDLISQYKDREVLYELRKEKRYYQAEILNTRKQLDELLSDSKSLEKFAREQHLMKKDNEDIWLVVDQNSKAK
ncbi:MAG: septum formation initiator family protein [Bacteroidia bacterium]